MRAARASAPSTTETAATCDSRSSEPNRIAVQTTPSFRPESSDPRPEAPQATPRRRRRFALEDVSQREIRRFAKTNTDVCQHLREINVKLLRCKADTHGRPRSCRRVQLISRARDIL